MFSLLFITCLFETFKKCSILPAQLNPHLIFNRGSRPRTILQDSRIGQLSSCPQGRGAWMPRVNAKILTTGIHGVFCGLKFEPDAGIGQKGDVFQRSLFLSPSPTHVQEHSEVSAAAEALISILSITAKSFRASSFSITAA
jgi:hypothetical protein